MASVGNSDRRFPACGVLCPSWRYLCSIGPNVLNPRQLLQEPSIYFSHLNRVGTRLVLNWGRPSWMGRGLWLGSCLAWWLPDQRLHTCALFCFPHPARPLPLPSPPPLSSPSPSTQRPQALPRPAAEPADNQPGVGPPGTPQRHPDWIFSPIRALYVPLCLLLANLGVRSPMLTTLPEDPRGPGV